MFGTTRIVQALIAEKAITAELRAEVARLQAHFDWLAAHVNELKLERAALLDRCLGIQLAAVPVIQREASGALPGADPGYVPAAGKLPNIGDILNKAREIVDEQHRPAAERGSLAGAELSGLSFEDMGDDAAAAAGVTHAADGTVLYTR